MMEGVYSIMKKALLNISAIIFFLLIFVACSKDVDKSRNIAQKSTNEPNSRTDISLRYDNEEGGIFYSTEEYRQYVINHLSDFDSSSLQIPVYYEEQIIYDNLSGIVAGLDPMYYYYMSHSTGTFYSLLYHFPNTAIRKNDNGYAYSIYDTESDTRIFTFLSIFEDGKFRVDRSALGGLILMKKTLEYENFKTIENGDGIEVVAEIDSVIPLYRKSFDLISRHIKAEEYQLFSIHILKDGVIKFIYEKKDNNYVIKDFIYNKNFILQHEIYGEVNYQIAEIDYVK